MNLNLKEDAVYFPLSSLYFRDRKITLKSWKELFTACEVDTTKDTVVETRIMNPKDLFIQYTLDLRVLRQITIGNSDQLFLVNEAQKEPGAFNNEDFSIYRYKYIKNAGIDYEWFRSMNGKFRTYFPFGRDRSEYKMFSVYDIVVLR